MNDETNERIRRVASWVILCFAGLFSLFHFGFIMFHAFRNSDWLLHEIVEKHYAAMIVLPSAGYAALCLVLFLDWRFQKMRFKALGFEFEGAAGPIVLWVLCFLACAIGIRLLW